MPTISSQATDKTMGSVSATDKTMTSVEARDRNYPEASVAVDKGLPAIANGVPIGILLVFTYTR